MQFKLKNQKKSRAIYFSTPNVGTEDYGIIVEHGKQPIYKLKKEVIRVGDFYKEGVDQSFSVNIETLDHWAAEFLRYTENGNKVSVPDGHEVAGKSSENYGWVTDLFRENDSLFAIMELYGDDVLTVTKASDVSIYSPPEIIDGNGIKYTYPITHIALTTVPVIPGLSSFETIAASQKNINIKLESKMKLAQVIELLGLSFDDDKMTDDEKEEKVLSAIKALKEKDDVKDDDDEDKKELSASRVSPAVLSLAKENRSMKLDALVESGKVTPAVKKALEKIYCDEKSLSLSLSKADDHFDEIVTILKFNDVVSLGSQTSPQIMELSDSLKTGKNLLLADIEKRLNPKK